MIHYCEELQVTRLPKGVLLHYWITLWYTGRLTGRYPNPSLEIHAHFLRVYCWCGWHKGIVMPTWAPLNLLDMVFIVEGCIWSLQLLSIIRCLWIHMELDIITNFKRIGHFLFWSPDTAQLNVTSITNLHDWLVASVCLWLYCIVDCTLITTEAMILKPVIHK